jgi:hypothetical protein
MRAQGFAFILSISLVMAAAVQKPSSFDVNQANNPWTATIAINFQDQRVTQLYEFAQGSKSFSLLSMLTLNDKKWPSPAQVGLNQRDCSAEIGDDA